MSIDLRSDSAHSLPVASRLAAREILGAAWPLFKACLPTCLPLAVIGVAAGATPGSEAAMTGGGRSVAYTSEWWGLTAASVLLTLICYGAVLRQQMLREAGHRQRVFESLRQATVDAPFVFVLLVLLAIPLVPAMLATAWRGFDLVSAALTLFACVLLVYGWFAWPALVDADLAAGEARGPRPRAPWAAIQRSLSMVQGRWLALLQVAGMLISAVLVFVLLTGILIGVVMGLAGQATPTAGGLALSRWLMALVLAIPVVYGGAVTVTTWRAVNAASTPR